ncbi:MAG: EamA family transporter [Eubacterium sp.]|nr:EamA family transporter [Eubacterium sp.]
MWILFAAGSAFFAGITAILAKCGIRQTDSNVATAIRTVIVLVFAWIMVFITGSQGTLAEVSGKTLLFLLLSGIATGASWLCYFKALGMGPVNKVVAVDKSSIILTLILAVLFFREGITWEKGVAIVLIGAGTFLMIEKKKEAGAKKEAGLGWFVYAALSAVFASLTSILGKIGITEIESNLGTALRTGVVLLMAWIVVLVSGKIRTVKKTPRKDLLFICLSGIATGASWLCYYRALQTGPASGVVPIDKLSILVTILFSYLVFHEKLSKLQMTGLLLMVAGTLGMVIG